jgi:hypothetical protein
LALTGEKPFTGQSSFEIMTKQREFTPPPPRQLNPAIPKEVSEMVMRMLAKNPQDRFKDADECRQAWLELGNRIGFMRTQGGGMNDSVRMAGELAKPRGGTSAPLPAMPVPMASPVAPPGSVPLPGSGTGEGPSSRPMTPDRRTRISGEFSAPSMDNDQPARTGSERQGRTITERRLATHRGSTGTGEATTCAKCGMLNRADVMTCTRCGNGLRDLTGDPGSLRDQEAEAQRLMQIGQHKEAAVLYARLADREQDKRARAILRSKEREARTLENQSQLHEVQSRSQGMISRGDIKGGIEILERGLANVRDAGASSTGAETRLMDDITALRSRLRQRRQQRLILIVVLIAVIIALVLFIVAPNGLRAMLKPVPPPTATSPSESGH